MLASPGLSAGRKNQLKSDYIGTNIFELTGMARIGNTSWEHMGNSKTYPNTVAHFIVAEGCTKIAPGCNF